ncbi:MAG: hypothetical protein LBP64_01135, partial [Tannerella sp.]|nr:hypothetical protein [Tannerella sp.]
MLSGFMRMQAQTTISPGSNPNPIVVMGDSIAFNVSVASSQAWPNGTIKVTLPAGFRLLPSTPHIIAGSLAADGLSARIAAPTTGSVTAGSVVRTLYVKPLCDAETAVAAELRKIAYAFYADADASGAPVVSKETDQISNFYNPILSVVYPEGSDVILNTTLTRVISITQTANASHVNNLRINAAVTDKTGITVSKIEVTADTASHVWTDITATGLDASQAGKYVYNITRANTFAPLNYPDARMNVDAKLYIRETVTLIKCSAGLVQYSVSYGDGLDFCPPLPAAAGNINLSVATPAYGADILNGTGGSAAYITWPTSPTNDGVWRVRVLNTATTDPTAIMKDIYLNFGIGGQYYMKKAYICNPDGTIVPGAGGATDTLFLAMTPGTGTPRTDVNFVST